MARTATTQTAVAQGIEQRLVKYLRAEDRFTHLNGTSRWSATAMRRTALTYYPEERLRQLLAEIRASADPGSLPRLLHKLKGTDVLASPHYPAYVPPSRARVLTKLWPGAQDDFEHDLRRFRTDIAEAYALAVWEAAEERTPGIFGPCDDPDGHRRQMEALTATMDALREDLRTNYAGGDVVHRDVLGAEGRFRGTCYAVSRGDVPLGDAEGLIAWGRTHRADLGL